MVLLFFPSPYPDELLYSVFARYHIWSQNISLKETVNDLYGRYTASTVVDLPNNLNAVHRNLSEITAHNVGDWIEYNTLFPLYRPFLSLKRSVKWCKPCIMAATSIPLLALWQVQFMLQNGSGIARIA